MQQPTKWPEHRDQRQHKILSACSEWRRTNNYDSYWRDKIMNGLILDSFKHRSCVYKESKRPKWNPEIHFLNAAPLWATKAIKMYPMVWLKCFKTITLNESILMIILHSICILIRFNPKSIYYERLIGWRKKVFVSYTNNSTRRLGKEKRTLKRLGNENVWANYYLVLSPRCNVLKKLDI